MEQYLITIILMDFIIKAAAAGTMPRPFTVLQKAKSVI
jgi:hypothetical protein